MILNKCNLRCPYCFADEFTYVNNYQFMSFEDFRHAVDFSVYNNPTERIGIIGGEPTIHPEFERFMEYVVNNENVKNVTVFTNGIELLKYVKWLIPAKVRATINVNPPSVLGKETYDRTVNVIDVLVNEYNLQDKIVLGINMFGNDFEYGYIVDLLKKYRFKTVRTSLVVPNHNSDELDVKKHMIGIKPRMLEFYAELLKIGTVPTWDCNGMPKCYLSEKESSLLRELSTLARNLGVSTNLTENSSCSGPIDILPTLEAVRCFGLSDKQKVSITKFRSLSELREYFYKRFDIYAKALYAYGRCKDCVEHNASNCLGGCLVYKIDKIERSRE